MHQCFHSTDQNGMASSGKLVALFKQGLNEIPELLFAGSVAAICVVGGFIRMYHYDKNDEWNKRYKYLPVLMRPDDPRVAKVHKT